MLEAALVGVRLAQYIGAAILFGSPLFILYALRGPARSVANDERWPQRLLLSGAALALAGSVAGLLVQTATMAGSFDEAMKPESLGFMVSGTTLGRAAVVRAGAALLAFVLVLLLKPGGALWTTAAVLGAVVAASLAWMGHGAATEGAGANLHLVSDIFHSLAASVWIGALTMFLMLLLLSARAPGGTRALHSALHGFAGIGSGLVAVLLATGLVNSWFLVGPDRVSGLLTTEYGRLLSLKLALFAGMLALAAANRFRLTPRLGAQLAAGGDPAAALGRLRSSLLLETTVGLGILGLVAWLGTLAPVAAQ